MNRIAQRFARLKQEGRKGLVTFITAGDPDPQQSLSILQNLPGAGADFIEIGMPFTDPMADGPAIQASSLRALAAGMTMKKTLEMVQQFRTKNSTTPILLMGYFNPIYSYGTEQFVTDAAQSGIDGLIIVDLPPEEDEELRKPATEQGLEIIRLITPTTLGERLETVLRGAGGFLYYVAIAGITGTRSANPDEIASHISRVKAHTDLPIAVGFGIRSPEDAQAMARRSHADAIVVGSEIVKTIAAAGKSETCTKDVTAQVQALAGSLTPHGFMKKSGSD